jgi:hypothetical protein
VRAQAVRADVERRLEPGLRGVLEAAADERRGSRYNLTLRELAALVGDAPPAAAPRGPAGPVTVPEPPVADAK